MELQSKSAAPLFLGSRLHQVVQVGQEVRRLGHEPDVSGRHRGVELGEGAHCRLAVLLIQPGHKGTEGGLARSKHGREVLDAIPRV